MKGTCTKLFFLCLLFSMWLPAHRSTAQTITTVAGNGAAGGNGDGNQAISASIKPMGVEVDDNGNFYIADTDHNRIRKVNALTGVISTVAGNGASGYAGDNGLATAAALKSPYDVAVAANGDLYIADYGNHRIRKVDAVTKIITTVTGSGFPGSTGDGGAAGSARIYGPAGLVLDAAGNLYLSEYNGNRIRKVAAVGGTVLSTSIITTVAGTGTSGFLGDNESLATAAYLKNPWGLALDASGDMLYIADLNNYRIRRVKLSTNQIKTIAGTGSQGFSGDGGLANYAKIGTPVGIAVSDNGNIYFSEKDGNRIRKVNSSDAKISTIAGSLSGTADWTGDGGPAANAQFTFPTGLDVDGDANIFIADYGNGRMRRIEGFINNGLALDEGSSAVLPNSVLEFSNTNQPPAAITYTLSSGVSMGRLFKDDNADGLADASEVLSAGSTFTQADVNADLIHYLHDGGENVIDNFGFTVTDNAGKTLTGQSFVLSITKVNDKPVITYAGLASLSTLEDTNLALTGLQMSDAEAGNDMVMLYLMATNGKILLRTDVPGGISSGEIFDNNNDSTYLTLMTSLPAINATLAEPDGLVFMPNANFNGAGMVELMLNDNASVSSGSGGPKTASISKEMEVTAINDEPVITSDGGGATAALARDESLTAVTTVTATDVPNEGSTLTFSLSGGADQALFSIDPTSGVLSFVTAPAFRLPTDTDANNTYEVRVRVTDNGFPTPAKYDEQAFTVTILDKTPPRVSSIVRLSPTDATTKVDPVVFRVSFDELVSNVDATDFILTKTGAAAGSISAVSASSGTQMDVTVSGVAGDGTLRLDVKGSGTGIQDPVGLDLAEAFASGDLYTIDNTAPLITGVENSKFYGSDPTVSFNEGTATLNGSAFVNNTVVSGEGQYTLVVTDVAGNFSTLSFDLDKTAPTGTLVINTGAAQTNLTGVSLALTTADGPGSQTADMRFSNDGNTWSAWEPYAAAKAHTLVSGDGLKTVYVELRDAVGNVSASISDQINLDQTLPTVLLASTPTDSVNAPFPVTITFSEEVTGFELADLVVTNGTASNFTSVDARNFTILITPAAEGWVKVAIPADKAQDIAANGNEVAETLIRLYDATKPVLTITGPVANPVNAPFPVTFTFSEPVSGFATGDVQVINGMVSNFQAQSASVYTATISPMAQAAVAVSVAAQVAADAAANGNEAAAPFSRIYDATRPMVIITATAANPVNAGFAALITFSEPVTGFDIGDVAISNGAASNFQALGATVYSVLITPAADGQVTLAVAANVAADAAANGNLAAMPLTRFYDATRPVVAISAAPADPVNAAFTATFTFSEPVAGFASQDIQVSNGTVTNFSNQNASVYTALITPAADGEVTVAVAANVAADAAANGNESAATLARTYDGTKPAVAISAPAADLVNAAFTATFTFSEPVSGFVMGDVVVGNGVASNFSAQSANVYTALITPAADGEVTVAVAANVAADAAANGNQAAATLARIFDGTRPAVAISAPAADPVNAAFTATFTFSEPVSGFAIGDIQVSNGSVSGFTTDGPAVYTALITPAADGEVTVAVAANVAADAAANGNEAAATLVQVYDATRPAVVISAPAADPMNAAFMATFTFSEPVSGFTSDDIQVSNGNVSGFTSEGPALYTALITPAANGQVSVAVAANVAADAAANGNEVAATLARTFDGTRPAVAISAPAADPVNAAFTATFTFSEPVTGFTTGDIQVSNGSVSGFASEGPAVYTALITPAADGQVSVAVAANVAADAAANGNEVAATLARTFDGTRPAVAISAPVADPMNAAFTATFIFSEPVSGFASGDIQVSNGSVSGFTAESPAVYTALITPAADGQVSVAVAANVAADVAANGNKGAATLARTYDATRPAVTLASTAAALTNLSPIPVSITFSEGVAGFASGDLTVTNGVVSGFTAVDAHTYQALISPLADGQVSVQLAAQVAADAAGNANTASNELQHLFDASRPEVVIASQAPAWVNASFPVSFTFSEPVADFGAADVTTVNASLSDFMALSATQYTATLTPAGAGEVSVSVAAHKAADAAGNGNLAAGMLSRTYDAVQPSVTLASAGAQLLNAPFLVKITFSEGVTGFDQADIAVNNGQASGFAQISDGAYSVLITPAGEGVVQVQVAPGMALDKAGNANAASNALTRTYDATRPAVLLATSVPAVSNVNPIPVSISFSEAVADFGLADVTVTGGTAGSFTGSGKDYSLLVTPSGDGVITVQVLADGAHDLATNGNLASNLLSRIFDGSRPSVVLSAQTDELVRIPFTATFTFSEPVTGFVAGDVGITNATVSNFLALSSSVYTATITPAPLGTIVVSVAENVAADQLQNGNLAAAPLIVEEVRCGNKNEKVLICHNGKMICISLNALGGHLGHGDKIGSCTTTSKPNARMAYELDHASQLEMEVYPNPAHAKTTIEFTTVQEGGYRLAIYDLKGVLVKNIATGQADSNELFSHELDVAALPQGVYLIQLTTTQKVVTKRLVVAK